MSDRIVLDVVRSAAVDGWTIHVRGSSSTKAQAVELASSIGRRLHEAGELAQVVVHNLDGTFEEERTYGSDPPESPG